THTVLAMAATAWIAAESVAPPPDGFSDMAYQAGVVGQEFRERLAAGTGTYADAQPQRGVRRGNQAGGRGNQGRGGQQAQGAAPAPAQPGGAAADAGGRGAAGAG